MHRWLEVFPREQLLVVNGDQLIEDPVSQLHRIETFLGKYLNNSKEIQWSGGVESLSKIESNNQRPTMLFFDPGQIFHTVAMIKWQSRWIIILFSLPGIEHRISSHNFYFNETKGFYCLRNDTADKCLRETKGRKHPHVDPLVISKLRKFFAEHNQKFYELVGEDLGWPEE